LGGAARLLIAAFKGERNSSRARQSPASGKYRFTGLWAGTFKIVFSPEASEFEEAEGEGITPDAYPTQWWYGQSTFAAATSIAITPPSTVEGVDGSLGPGPPAAATPSPAPPGPLSPPVQKVVKSACRDEQAPILGALWKTSANRSV
jgi:hypothetical protein